VRRLKQTDGVAGESRANSRLLLRDVPAAALLLPLLAGVAAVCGDAFAARSEPCADSCCCMRRLGGLPARGAVGVYTSDIDPGAFSMFMGCCA
jgi:hypothetical protein